MYSYDSTRNQQLDRGLYGAIAHKRKERFTVVEDMAGAEVATTNGITVTAWIFEDSTGSGVKVSVFDDDTGAVYYHNLWNGQDDGNFVRDNIIAKNDSPGSLKVVAIGSIILLMWHDNSTNDINTLPIRTWDIENSMAATPVTTVASTGAAFDVTEIDDMQVGLFYTLDSGTTRVGLVNTAGTLILQVEHDSKKASHGGSITYQPFDQHLYVASLDDDGATQAEITTASYNVSDLTPDQPPTVDTAPGFDPFAISITTYMDTPTTVGYTIFTEVVDQAIADLPEDHSIVWIRFTISPTTGNRSLAEGGVYQHAFVASHGWHDGENGYALIGHDSRSGLQNAYYIINAYGILCGRMHRFEGADRSSFDTTMAGDGDLAIRLTHPRTYQGVFQCVLSYKQALDSEADDIDVRQHLTLQRWELDTNHQPVTEEVNNALYFTGSQLHYFDGVAPVEAGFHMFPDMLDGDFTEGVPAGNMAGGAYNYRVYYVWLCPITGQKMRSNAITRTVTIANSKCVDIVIPSLAFTMKKAFLGVSDVWIEVFRTEVDSSTLFFKVTSDDPATIADPQNNWVLNPLDAFLTVTFQDNMIDIDLVSKEIDYISQGELGNFSPLAPTFIKAVGDRLFAVGGEIPENQVQYSKINHNDEPVDFSIRTVVDNCPEEGGDVRSISYINDVPLILKDQFIFAIVGDGLDDTGLSGGYATRTISTDAGVESPRAVAELPGLVIWPSGKGIYAMDQALTPGYIGAPVEGFNAQNYVAAEVIPDTNMVVFFPQEGDAVFYDYFYKRWGTWTNHAVVDAAVIDFDKLVTLRSDGRIFIRDVELATDAGAAYSARYRLGPFRLTEHMDGFGDSNTRFFKIRKWQLLGEYESVHLLKCRMFYNREISPFQEFTFDPTRVIDTTLWGAEGFLWGDPLLFWGGKLNPNDYHFEKRPRRDKAQSISFEFEDVPGDNPGKSFELTELLLEVAPYPGMSRLPATRKL
jgi:hypothetical protein